MYVWGNKTNRLLRHVRNIIMYVNLYLEVLLLTLLFFD